MHILGGGSIYFTFPSQMQCLKEEIQLVVTWGSSLDVTVFLNFGNNV